MYYTQSKKTKAHRHKFEPAISFDWQGNDIIYGVCSCGEVEA